MRALAALPLIAFALSACDVPLAPDAPTGPRAMSPFTWKANTPRVVRAYDINECETSARGVSSNATAEEIAAASAAADPGQVAAFVRRCLQNKGYTVTEKPVCQASDYRGGQLVQGADVLPPLERIRCVDPVARGIVVTA